MHYKKFDKWAESYDKSILNKIIFNPVRKQICNILENLKDKKVLDIGCGTGTLLEKLARENSNSYFIGIDSSEKMIEIANKKRRSNLEFTVEDASKLPFSGESFDYVISTISFHHWLEQERVIKDCYKILKKEGKLIIADLSLPIKFLGGKGTNKILTGKKMKKLFEDSGFKVEQYVSAPSRSWGYLPALIGAGLIVYGRMSHETLNNCLGWVGLFPLVFGLFAAAPTYVSKTTIGEK